MADKTAIGGECGGPEVRRLVERCDHRRVTPAINGICCLCDGTGWKPKPEIAGLVAALDATREERDTARRDVAKLVEAASAFQQAEWATRGTRSGTNADWQRYEQTRTVLVDLLIGRVGRTAEPEPPQPDVAALHPCDAWVGPGSKWCGKESTHQSEGAYKRQIYLCPEHAAESYMPVEALSALAAEVQPQTPDVAGLITQLTGYGRYLTVRYSHTFAGEADRFQISYEVAVGGSCYAEGATLAEALTNLALQSRRAE